MEYGDLLNYTFAILEKKLSNLTKVYTVSHRSEKDHSRSVKAMLAILEFSFFAYSASPKVNHTIRVCRMISACVDLLKAGGFSYDMKHLVYKYVHDNVMQQLEKNTMGLYREIESLYLLISLSEIGKEYWLPEATLARHFVIGKKNDGTYEHVDFLSHFSITVLLSYIKEKSRYDGLRKFIEAHSVAKLEFVKAHCPNDAEALMLMLDLAVCPYIAPATISALGGAFGLSAGDLTAIQVANDQWFTAWGKKFDVGKELDAKRSREVY